MPRDTQLDEHDHKLPKPGTDGFYKLGAQARKLARIRYNARSSTIRGRKA
jgi:hypothetical protein